MPQSDWTEIVVFLHGITPDDDPEAKKHDPRTDYQRLFKNIQKELKRWPEKPPIDPVPIEVIWNWKPQGEPTVYADQDLAEGERRLAAMARKQELKMRAKNPIHYLLWKWLYQKLRNIMVFGFADAFYYVSKDGETTVRQHVFECLSDEIEKRLGEQGQDGGLARISLTFVGHSAGTLIAHDFLYHLFKKKATPVSREVDKVLKLRKKTVGRRVRLRIRRLYTFGSPITAWLLRANSLVEKVMSKEPLHLDDLGLKEQTDLPNPRWINFWTLTDVAAFPLSELYDRPEAVCDQYVDVGLWFPATHGAYWNSSSVARHIADNF